MNPTIKNVLAVILGLVIGSIVNMGIINMSSSIIPPPEGADVTSMEGLKESIHLFQPKHFIMPFLAHALGTLVGALIAALIDPVIKSGLQWPLVWFSCWAALPIASCSRLQHGLWWWTWFLPIFPWVTWEENGAPAGHNQSPLKAHSQSKVFHLNKKPYSSRQKSSPLFRILLVPLLLFSFMASSCQNPADFGPGHYRTPNLSKLGRLWYMVLNGTSRFAIGNNLQLKNDSTYVFTTCLTLQTGHWRVTGDTLLLNAEAISWKNDSLQIYGLYGRQLILPKKAKPWLINGHHLQHIDITSKGNRRLVLLSRI